MRLPRLEPSTGYLSHLRNAGDLDLLVAYLDDPCCTQRFRRRVTLRIASMAPGGGRASALRGSVDPAVIPHLGPLLEADPDPGVRRSAAYGLRRTGDTAAIPPLLNGLADADKATRIHSIIGLGELKAREALEPLTGLLDDGVYAGTAAKALGQIGDERALGPLRIAAATSKSGRQRKLLERAIGEVDRSL
jgi:HEAT repeat protein